MDETVRLNREIELFENMSSLKIKHQQPLCSAMRISG
jgi:hypothetical protein